MAELYGAFSLFGTGENGLSYNVSSFWFQLSLGLICAYLFISLASWRFGFSVFRKREGDSNVSSVPWGLDVALSLFIVYLIVAPAFIQFLGKVSVKDRFIPAQESAQTVENKETGDVPPEEGTPEPQTAETPSPKDDRDLSTQHPVARMLVRAKGTPYFIPIILVFIAAVVVVAPATEELVFRVVLQGAFERAARIRFGEPNPDPDPADAESPGASNRPNARVALAAIIPPALLFALLHAAAPEDPSAPQSAAALLYATLCGSVANVLTILICVSFLVIVSRATAGDLGCAARGEGEGESGVQTPVLARLIREFSQGLVLYAFVAPIVYLVKITLQNLYPSVIVDPAPILIFALAEGAVYYKTRSYPTVLGMHMGLNATSFLLLCMSIA
ncbi:MAG: CPBP family intramembrane metalloprotease [Thermoguttaceae bacterium]|nr:CPBP family intramembrane metalloprotease [Thermoguttaceae bacterium]